MGAPPKPPRPDAGGGGAAARPKRELEPEDALPQTRSVRVLAAALREVMVSSHMLPPPGATDGGALHQRMVAQGGGGGAVFYERPVRIEAGSVIAPVFSMLYNTNFTHGT